VPSLEADVVLEGHRIDYLRGRRGRRTGAAHLEVVFSGADWIPAVVLPEQLPQIAGQSGIDRADFRVHGDSQGQGIGWFSTPGSIGQLRERNPDLARGPDVGIRAVGATGCRLRDF